MKKLLIAIPICALAWMGSAQRTSVEAAAYSPSPSPSPSLSTSRSTGLYIPVVGIERTQLHDNFYEGRVGHIHDALDIMAARGTPVIAAVDGTIRKLYTSRDGGRTIYEFDSAETRSYYYAHLDRYGSVAEGQQVHAGDVIGYVGSTGNATTPHLHFGIAVLTPEKKWWKGEWVDPYPELERNGVTKR